jgi:hypothetical protein
VEHETFRLPGHGMASGRLTAAAFFSPAGAGGPQAVLLGAAQEVSGRKGRIVRRWVDTVRLRTTASPWKRRSAQIPGRERAVCAGEDQDGRAKLQGAK